MQEVARQLSWLQAVQRECVNFYTRLERGGGARRIVYLVWGTLHTRSLLSPKTTVGGGTVTAICGWKRFWEHNLVKVIKQCQSWFVPRCVWVSDATKPPCPPCSATLVHFLTVFSCTLLSKESQCWWARAHLAWADAALPLCNPASLS